MVCALSEENLIRIKYLPFLKQPTGNILSLMSLPQIYYFMEKHVKLPQLRDHSLIT